MKNGKNILKWAKWTKCILHLIKVCIDKWKTAINLTKIFTSKMAIKKLLREYFFPGVQAF